MPGKRKRVEVDEDEETHPVKEGLGSTREKPNSNVAELGEQWKNGGERGHSPRPVRDLAHGCWYNRMLNIA